MNTPILNLHIKQYAGTAYVIADHYTDNGQHQKLIEPLQPNTFQLDRSTTPQHSKHHALLDTLQHTLDAKVSKILITELPPTTPTDNAITTPR